MQVIACMRALVNALLMNGLFASMHTLEDIPAEFFGGALPAKKQQKQMDAADAPSPGSASSNDHMPLPPKQRRLPNLFPTLPALHKFIERYVTTSGLIMRDGTRVPLGQCMPSCGAQCARGRAMQLPWLCPHATAVVRAGFNVQEFCTLLHGIVKYRAHQTSPWCAALAAPVPCIIWGRSASGI